MIYVIVFVAEVLYVYQLEKENSLDLMIFSEGISFTLAKTCKCRIIFIIQVSDSHGYSCLK